MKMVILQKTEEADIDPHDQMNINIENSHGEGEYKIASWGKISGQIGEAAQGQEWMNE